MRLEQCLGRGIHRGDGHVQVGTVRAIHGQAVGTAGAHEGDAAGHHQDIARVTLQVGSSSHTAQLDGTPSSAPHTLRSKLPPTIPSQACCSWVVSRKVILEQQGVQQTRAAPQQGRWHRPVCYPDGTEHTCPGPRLCPEKLCHQTGQAQTSLSKECPAHCPACHNPHDRLCT